MVEGKKRFQIQGGSAERKLKVVLVEGSNRVGRGSIEVYGQRGVEVEDFK